MTSWHKDRLLSFDLETSGIQVETDRIVTAAAIFVGGGKDPEPHTWLSDVDGVEIPEAATAVHKITTEHAHAHGRPAKEVVEQLVTVLAEAVAAGIPIVGHNIGAYDLTLLDREARRHLGHGLDTTNMRVIDTRVLDQHVLPIRRRVSQRQGARQLITLAQVYDFPWNEEEAHSAEYDARMAACIAYRINQIAHTEHADRPEFVQLLEIQLFDDLDGLDLDQLHAAQVIWAAEQAASLQGHLRRLNPDVVVDGRWPLIPFGGDQ